MSTSFMIFMVSMMAGSGVHHAWVDAGEGDGDGAGDGGGEGEGEGEGEAERERKGAGDETRYLGGMG